MYITDLMYKKFEILCIEMGFLLSVSNDDVVKIY